MARGTSTTSDQILYGQMAPRQAKEVVAKAADDLETLLPSLLEYERKNLDSVALLCLDAPADQAGTVTIERMVVEFPGPISLTAEEAESILKRLATYHLVENTQDRGATPASRWKVPYRLTDLGAQIYKIRWDQAKSGRR